MVERISGLKTGGGEHKTNALNTANGTSGLDAVFGSLSDQTRRDILECLGKRSMTVGEIAEHYKLSLAGVAKHLEVLERAGLVTKTRQGKTQNVALAPKSLAGAFNYLKQHRQIWEQRLDSLAQHLKTIRTINKPASKPAKNGSARGGKGK